jgi:hypothetical protein
MLYFIGCLDTTLCEKIEIWRSSWLLLSDCFMKLNYDFEKYINKLFGLKNVRRLTQSCHHVNCYLRG